MSDVDPDQYLRHVTAGLAQVEPEKKDGRDHYISALEWKQLTLDDPGMYVHAILEETRLICYRSVRGADE